MAKGISVEVDNLARKAKKGCIGVNDIARKIKKGYIGVGGVARPFFSSEKKVMRYGNATTLTRTVEDAAAAGVGNYALFAGGLKASGTTYYNNVDAYDVNLVKKSAPALSRAAFVTGANSTNRKHALFAGGAGDSTTYDNTVQVYDENLVKSSADTLSIRSLPAVGGNIGNYVFFMNSSTSIDAYDENLVKSSAPALSTYGAPSVANVGDYVVFAGFNEDYTNVDAYDINLTKKSATALRYKHENMFAGSTGNHAIFAGGTMGGGNKAYAYAYVYDRNLVQTTPFNMIVGRSHGAYASLKGFALFVGGRTNNSSSDVKNTVEVYDENLIQSQIDGLSQARIYFNGTTVGNYMLFAGGYHYSSGTCFNTVDAYQVFE